jgi:hypothetical protein
MPVYKGTINYKGTHYLEFEAMGDDEAGERAAEIFDEINKGNLGADDIEITQNTYNRMDSETIAERRAENRGDI